MIEWQRSGVGEWRSCFPFLSFLWLCCVVWLCGAVCVLVVSIIMGVPIPVGTGLFQLLHKVDKIEKSKLLDTFSKSNLLLHAPEQRLGLVA